jgi:branched-chain amino acid transport system permease protein
MSGATARVNQATARRWGLPALGVILLILYPIVLPLLFNANQARYWTLSIGANALILGIVALSLIFMSGYGGMVSLAQASLAGFAAYVVALMNLLPSTNATGGTIGLGLPPIPSAIIALVMATLAGALVGAIASRSSGIYFLMLTLAIAVGFFYVVLQNYEFFGGHIGFAGIVGPTGQPRANPVAFYYMCLIVAVLAYGGLKYLVRTQLGLTFQGIRDNPRRMRALGYRVTLHRVAIFALGGFVAGLSGVLGVWYRGNISPGVVDISRVIDVLVIAVIGGLGYPIGAFVGAAIFLVLDVFASSIVLFGFKFDERFNSLIGLAFVVIVLVAPHGLVGLVDRAWKGGRLRFSSRGAAAVETAATEPAGNATDVVPAPVDPIELPDEPDMADDVGSNQ